MAKRWRALHRRKQRPRIYCEYRYHQHPRGEWDIDESTGFSLTKIKCGQHAQVKCVLNPWDKTGERFCCQHAEAEGFCMGCGLFSAGMERFDFGPYRGYCDNCADEIRGNEYDEYEDDGRDYGDDFDDDFDEADCTWCGGEGLMDNDDPLWYGADELVDCSACNGTGQRKHQTVF